MKLGRLKEFKYSSDNYHRVISIISWILELNGYNKTDHKILKRGEYNITHDGAELVVKRQAVPGHWYYSETNDYRYIIRHGDNGKYSCFTKDDYGSQWHCELHLTKEGKPWHVEARHYQYCTNGDIDDNARGVECIISSVKNFLRINGREKLETETKRGEELCHSQTS